MPNCFGSAQTSGELEKLGRTLTATHQATVGRTFLSVTHRCTHRCVHPRVVHRDMNPPFNAPFQSPISRQHSNRTAVLQMTSSAKIKAYAAPPDDPRFPARGRQKGRRGEICPPFTQPSILARISLCVTKIPPISPIFPHRVTNCYTLLQLATRFSRHKSAQSLGHHGLYIHMNRARSLTFVCALYATPRASVGRTFLSATHGGTHQCVPSTSPESLGKSTAPMAALFY
jgi:hypothetical protein